MARRDGWLQGFEPVEPAFQRRLVGEEDDERVVAGHRAHLLGQGGFVDRLGDDVGRAGLAGEDEDQAAAADDDRDVGEDPPQALVGRRAGAAGRATSGLT